MNANTTKMILTLPEAAKELGIGENLMRQLAHRDDFPAFKIGNRWRIPLHGLEAWVAEKAEQRAGTDGEGLR